MVTRQKSVCFFSPYITPVLCRTVKNTGGAERQFALFGRYLHECGWGVSYLVERNDMCLVVDDVSWYKLHPINSSYMGGSRWHLFPGIVSLLRAMVRSDADVFVLKTQAYLLFPMSLYCVFFGKKLVFWLQSDRDCCKNRDDIPRILSWVKNLGMKFVHLFIAQSRNQASQLSDNFGYSVTIVPSIAAFVNGEIDSACDDKIEDQHPVVLWCGNSSIQKRQEVFFELSEMMPEINFMMAIGRADTSRYNQAQLRAKNISNLKFLGSVPPQEMEEWFSKVALYVNTSVFEGFPNTFLQSWQAGIPVVSLNVDPDSVLSEKQLGVVVKDEIGNVGEFDFKALASAIAPEVLRLVNDSDLRVSIGQRAKLYVSQNHVESIVGAKLEHALLDLL